MAQVGEQAQVRPSVLRDTGIPGYCNVGGYSGALASDEGPGDFNLKFGSTVCIPK
jgi:hypothetical protein